MSKPRVRFWLVLYFALGMANVLLYRGWDRALIADNQHYFFIAERAASGVPPHISQVDPKTMLGPLLTAATIRIARPFGLDDIHAARLLSFAVTAASVSFVWLLGWRLSGDPWAGHFAALALLGVWAFFHEGAIGARPKVFLVFFQLAAHAAVAVRRPALAGAAAAGAFLCWQPGALVGGALFASLLLLPALERRRSLVPFVGAGLAVVALYETYFLLHGALGVQLYQSFVLPAKTQGSVPYLSHTLGLIFGGGRLQTLSAAWLPVLSMVALFWLWLRIVTEPKTVLGLARRFPQHCALWLAAHFALAWTVLDNQAHPDLLLLQPYLVVIVGLALAYIARRVADPDDPSLRRVLVVGGLVVMLATVWSASAADRENDSSVASQIALGREVGELLRDYDGVWAIGCTHLLAFNHVDNWNSYGFFFDDVIQEILREGDWKPMKDGELPPIILLSRGLYPGARIWLSGNYEELTTEPFKEQRIRVLRRIGAVPRSELSS